jgi:hypothetical protein
MVGLALICSGVQMLGLRHVVSVSLPLRLLYATDWSWLNFVCSTVQLLLHSALPWEMKPWPTAWSESCILLLSALAVFSPTLPL